MLFDKTPDEVLSEDAHAREQRLLEEREARERWQHDIDAGRRQREEKREAAKRFQEKVQDATPAERARAAMESGATIFQVAIPLALGAGVPQSPAGDHNPMLNLIEAQGWRLVHADYVMHDEGSTRALHAIYIFRRTV